MSSQSAATSASTRVEIGGAIGPTAARAAFRVAASPRKKTTSATPPAGSSSVVRIAAQASKPAPTLLDSGAAARERRRIGQRAIAADEFAPVAGQICLRAAHIGEGDARTEIRVPGIAREHRAGAASISVSMKASEADRDAASTHST